ncbi:cysteine hydrolase [Mesorhizobium sp. B2-4-13]|uniref:cysteine hydrolase family protein n=1 Tax=Mesorhizobium sp. B2-4-13 TaxID=2589936 RepID=UPI00114D9C63|nr:cysteine hydrolase family protein [Mesorhizobium sp. B2-4-13]TPK80000.1 cysteine hydrolase [Mesorhizobium sp. B2-4-13]
MTTALMIIDVQHGILANLVDGGRQVVIHRELEAVAARLGRLKLAAEAAGVPVVVVQHDGDAGHRLEVGSPGWQLREEVSAIQDTILIRKRSCDAFHNTDLAYRLRELEVDRLVIGGCMTQFCVDTTTRRAVSEGFDVTLVRDGHTTADFGSLLAEQIVDHHNRVLSGFDAGLKKVGLLHADEIRF